MSGDRGLQSHATACEGMAVLLSNVAGGLLLAGSHLRLYCVWSKSSSARAFCPVKRRLAAPAAPADRSCLLEGGDASALQLTVRDLQGVQTGLACPMDSVEIILAR